MNFASAYTDSQSLTLEGERAFEELYGRLARWSGEAARAAEHEPGAFEPLVEKCLSLLGFMDRCIDISSNYDVAAGILSLHRFAIGALVKAKAERNAEALSGLPQIFVSLGAIFAAIRSTREPARNQA